MTAATPTPLPNSRNPGRPGLTHRGTPGTRILTHAWAFDLPRPYRRHQGGTVLSIHPAPAGAATDRTWLLIRLDDGRTTARQAEDCYPIPVMAGDRLTLRGSHGAPDHALTALTDAGPAGPGAYRPGEPPVWLFRCTYNDNTTPRHGVWPWPGLTKDPAAQG